MHAKNLLRLAAILVPLAAAPAQAADDTIRPGDFHRLSDQIWCTLNYVFDGVGPAAGRVFMGSAAHCVVGAGSAVGHEVTLGSGPENGPSDVAGTTGGEVLGTVALLGGDGTGAADDFALIEVRPALRDRVTAGVRGHEQIPTGVSEPDGPAPGDLLIHTGYGIPFFATQPTRDDRQGVYRGHDGSAWAGALAVYGGDSGGPVLEASSGRALGILQGYMASTLPDPDANVTGPTVKAIEARAAALGLPVRMRAVGDPVPPPPPPPAPAAKPAAADAAPAASQPAVSPSAKPAAPRPSTRPRSRRPCRAATRRNRGRRSGCRRARTHRAPSKRSPSRKRRAR
jgi:hypothetical protein